MKFQTPPRWLGPCVSVRVLVQVYFTRRALHFQSQRAMCTCIHGAAVTGRDVVLLLLDISIWLMQCSWFGMVRHQIHIIHVATTSHSLPNSPAAQRSGAPSTRKQPRMKRFYPFSIRVSALLGIRKNVSETGNSGCPFYGNILSPIPSWSGCKRRYWSTE